jgi:hypothetical protein
MEAYLNPQGSMKALDSLKGRPRFKIVGVIVHGVGHWVYVVPPTLRGGAALTCTILHTVLEEVFSLLRKDNKPLPAHLWIQADNCGGENKNHILLGFCAMLVGRGVFKTVQVNHLVVGHTHEDIDAFFGIISRILKGSPLPLRGLYTIGVNSSCNTCHRQERNLSRR